MKPSLDELYQSIPEGQHPIEGLSSFDLALANGIHEEYIFLVSVLLQGWSWQELDRFMLQLLKLKSRFWELPVLYQEDFFEILSQSNIPKGYEINSKVPGIVWSVGEFIRSFPNWTQSLVNFKEAEDLTRKIFYFGANSKDKPKLRRMLLLLKIFVDKPEFSLSHMAFPLSDSAIHFFSKTRDVDYFFSLDTWGKMKFYNKSCLKLTPSDPLKAYSMIERFQ